MSQNVRDIDVYMDRNGCVIDKEILDVTFKFFNLSKPKKIKNSLFKGGGTEYNADVALFSDAHLENVVFENFKSGRFLLYTIGNKIHNVTFLGSKTRSVMVRPSPLSDHEDGDAGIENISLDLSKYKREVDIVGVHPDAILTDPSRHLKIDVNPFINDSRRDIAEKFNSGIQDMVALTLSNRARYGIFSYAKREKEQQEFIDDLKILSKVGALIE